MIKVITAAGCLIFGGLVLMIYLGPPGPNLTCHRMLDGTFEQWKLETTNGNWYPNVEGSSIKSLAVLAPYMNGMTELRDYRYVPGLKSGDPKEFILMYVKEPSRRKWHGDTHWLRKEKRWVVLNPQMWDGEADKWSEVAEWIPTEEFTNRLTKTIQFLSENRRDYWTNAVKEHSEYLQSLRK